MADASSETASNDGDKKYSTPPADPRNMQEMTQYIQNLLQTMQDKFQTMSDQIINRIDEMGTRIDDLEKNISDIMTQAGVESEK